MPWLEEQEVLQEAPQAAGPDSQARLRDRRHASDPVRAVRPRSTHKVQTAAHVLCPVAARSQPARDWYAQPLARPPPLASRAANPRRAWMRSTPVQARRQEGHRHGAARGDYPSDGQPLPQPNRWAQREHGLVPPAHGACSRRHQRAARRCAPRSTPPRSTLPARPSSGARAWQTLTTRRARTRARTRATTRTTRLTRPRARVAGVVRRRTARAGPVGPPPHPTLPSQYRHSTVTVPSQCRHSTATPPLHHHHTTVTPPSHHHHTTITPPSHHRHTTITPPSHHLPQPLLTLYLRAGGGGLGPGGLELAVF